MSSSPDMQPPPGVVELREDVPLKPSSRSLAGPRLCGGGPRVIIGAFAVLTVAITIALLTQIYYGDYEVVPHGSVSSSAAACSRAGSALLRAGGAAPDAAAAAALCLAVLAPHRTSLDASGALVHWEYRQSRAVLPTTAVWGAGGDEVMEDGASLGVGGNSSVARPPRLVAALAALHARLGLLPWEQVVQPAIDLAREGYVVSASLSAAAAARGLPGYTPNALRTESALADYLESLKNFTSTELCAAWACAGAGADGVRWAASVAQAAGAWRVWAAGAGGARAAAALQAALAPGVQPDSAAQSAVQSLQAAAAAAGARWPRGVAAGLAVVDPRDTYVAFVTGLSTPFGSELSAGSAAWSRDEPSAPLDLAPAIITDQHICGTRYVVGGESGAALAQAAAAALAGAADAVDAVEAARVLVLPGGALAAEPARPPPAPAPAPAPTAPPAPGTPQLPALNFVQQKGDALLSHADSRGEGLASRF